MSRAMPDFMNMSNIKNALQYLNIIDNINLKRQYKLTKTRPIYELLTSRFMNTFQCNFELQMDKAMLPFKRSHQLGLRRNQSSLNINLGITILA